MLDGWFCSGADFVVFDSDLDSSVPQDTVRERRMVEAVVVVIIFRVFFITNYFLAASGYRFNERLLDL